MKIVDDDEGFLLFFCFVFKSSWKGKLQIWSLLNTFPITLLYISIKSFTQWTNGRDGGHLAKENQLFFFFFLQNLSQSTSRLRHKLI